MCVSRFLPPSLCSPRPPLSFVVHDSTRDTMFCFACASKLNWLAVALALGLWHWGFGFPQIVGSRCHYIRDEAARRGRGAGAHRLPHCEAHHALGLVARFRPDSWDAVCSRSGVFALGQAKLRAKAGRRDWRYSTALKHYPAGI